MNSNEGKSKDSADESWVPFKKGWEPIPSGIANPIPPTSPSGVVPYERPAQSQPPASCPPQDPAKITPSNGDTATS